MKKNVLKKIIIGVSIATVCMLNGGSIKALQLVKSYDYDDNTFVGGTNFRNYVYKEMPADVNFEYDEKTRIGSGWNYISYHVIKWYSRNGTWY